MIEKLMDAISEKLLPIATKIANQKFLVALRDSFIGIMPVIMTGSLAILLNAFLVDLPGQFGLTGITETFDWLISINNLIFKGSIAIVSLLFVYCLGVNIAKVYKTDTLSSGLVSLASFVIAIGNSVSTNIDLSKVQNLDVAKVFEGIKGVTVNGNKLAVTISGLLPGKQINATGYFTAIVIGTLASVVFCKFMNKNWTIKLPDSVPPAIAKPFMSIIPAALALYTVAIATFLLNKFTGKLFIEVVYELIQRPLLGMSQNLFVVILIGFIIQLLWFFGLHGGNVMAPIMEGVFGVALLANMEAFQKQEAIPYVWTSVSYSAFVFYSGLGVVIAIFWQCKNKHYREVAKLGLVPVLFNIGEPVNYGIPLVLNPIFFIPRVLCPMVMSAVAYIATDLGWVSPITQNVTWVMPPVLYGFFATGFDWRALVLGIVNLIIAILIYLPFLKMADKEVN